jgi:hypothetical protein
VAIDGADEVDPALNVVKGRGGALLREKVTPPYALPPFLAGPAGWMVLGRDTCISVCRCVADLARQVLQESTGNVCTQGKV